jgi:CAAX protease family protein
MRKLMRSHPIAAYFVLACLISWTIWLPLVTQSRGASAPSLRYQHFFGAIGPSAAALIIAAISMGYSGVVRLGRDMAKWHVGVHWYLISLFGPAALYVIGATGVGLYSGTGADFSRFGQSDEFPTLGLTGVWLLQTMTFGVGEEVGWRGFALPRLQTKHSALSATLMLSIIWAIWHIPTFFYRPGYSNMSPADIVGWYLSLLTGAILLTWLYNSSKGSVLIAALFHGSVDVAFTSKLMDARIMTAMGVLIVVWAIVVILVAGPANLSMQERQQIRPVRLSTPAREVARHA